MGKHIPALAEQPELPIYLEFALECYNQLSTERAIGFSIGPIPWTSIMQWARMAGMDDADDIDDLAEVVWIADNMVQDHLRKKPTSINPGAKNAPQQPTKTLGSGLPKATGRIVSGR